MAIWSGCKKQDLFLFDVIIPGITLIIATIVLIAFKSFVWCIIFCCLYAISIFYGLTILQYVTRGLLNLNAISEAINSKDKGIDPCHVCYNSDCRRHKVLPHSTKVKVSEDFDNALQQLLEDLLRLYVVPWYSNLSSNEAFVHQIRLAIATATKNLAIRILQADIPAIVFDRIVPLSLQHAEDYKKFKPRNEAHYNRVFIHPAARSRKSELRYLRGLVKAIMPQLLPAIHISGNNMVILREIISNWILLPALDALADPDNINLLITLSTNRDTYLSTEKSSTAVPILQRWVTGELVHNFNNGCFKPNLEDVLNDNKLLYLFMQHVKENGPMSLFQFCLDIDDLSKRLLNPELTASAEESLYNDVRSMYEVYLDPEAKDYLQLPRHISLGIQRILDDSKKSIEELRTSRPFYEAHQEAHALLETTCLPSFHHSYQLYDLICGMTAGKQTVYNRTSGNTAILITDKQDNFPVPTIVNRQLESKYLLANVEMPERDLTTWRVSIPHVDNVNQQPLYMINVHSASAATSWAVLRRDNDFHALRMRLIEFHGDAELLDTQLPIKKQCTRMRYEEFLQKLLSKPVLKSSELLYAFLTNQNSKQCFPNYTTGDLGILYQSMAYRLRKEKGQHLDRFMGTFLNSTQIKWEHADIGVDLISGFCFSTHTGIQERLEKGFFGDNFSGAGGNVDCSAGKHLNGACMNFVDAIDRLLNTPPFVQTLLWIFASTLRSNLDPCINRIVHTTLTKLFNGDRAATVVQLLHAKIIKDGSEPVPKSTDYYQSARKGLVDLIPCWLVGFRGMWLEIVENILNPLQDPPFNKHLVYEMLDHVLYSLFPEIVE